MGIDLFVFFRSKIRNKELYGPASNYNAVLHYKTAEGVVEKIVFIRKEVVIK